MTNIELKLYGVFDHKVEFVYDNEENLPKLIDIPRSVWHFLGDPRLLVLGTAPENMSAVDESARTQTFIEKTIDDIVNDQIEHRIKIVQNLMQDPGFLSTFGDDFVIEFGDLQVYTENRREIDSFVLNIRQDIKFRRRTEKDQEQN